MVIEHTVDVVEGTRLRSRRPDYLFKVDFPRFTVEAKKPSVDLDADRDAIFQVKRDAWNLQIPSAVLTDFQQFRVFDTTRTPVHAEPTAALVRDLSMDFSGYVGQWDVLLKTFGRAAVGSGSLEALRAKLRKAPAGKRLRTVDRMLIDLRGDQPVNDVFLSFLERHRQHLAAVLYAENRAAFPEADTLHGAAKLTEMVQRVLDRLVFIRVCEDRDVIPWGGLRELLDRVSDERGELYPTLCARFREFDQSFNGYLYKPHPSEQLTIDGGVLADLIRSLYPPDGPWNFATMGDDLLARVYERFLGNTITVAGTRVDVTEKPEVRHAGGVYYTPRFVVDSILRRVVAPKLAGKTPAEVLDVKVLDPACGSGSFVVVAFQLLIDHCRAAVAADPSLAEAVLPGTPVPKKPKKPKPTRIAFRDRADVWQLTPEFRALLLTSCIHGVDIDQQAVEVTIMSLYLKMVEVPLPPNWQRDLIGGNKLLPVLDNNVRCGNSLIDQTELDRYTMELHGDLFSGDDDARFRVNAFDWTSETRGFGRVLNGGRNGFDSIIGNPPYIRVQELTQWAPEACAFYKWAYQSAKAGNYDIYVVFVERCLTLLAADGLLGFIMPHKWWQAAYGEGLRSVVVKGCNRHAVVDFTDEQVFDGATTYTAIQTFGRQPVERVDVARFSSLDDGPADLAAVDAGEPSTHVKRFDVPHPAGSGEWQLVDAATRGLLDQLRAAGPPLGTLAERVFVGIQTSGDAVFILDDRDGQTFSRALGRPVNVERELLHPLLKGSVHMKRWLPDQGDRAVLFPYRRNAAGGFELIPPKKMADRYPLAWDYLNACREILTSRERGRDQGETWYGYVYPKNFAYMTRRKLLAPAMVRRAEFGLDAAGEYFFVGSGAGGGGGYGIVLPETQSYELWLGILNSRLLEWFARQVSTPFQHGWFSFDKGVIEQLPIKLPTTPAERTLADRIETSVRQVTAAKAKLCDPALSDRERSQHEQAADSAERRIDADVFALYGVEGLPT